HLALGPRAPEGDRPRRLRPAEEAPLASGTYRNLRPEIAAVDRRQAVDSILEIPGGIPSGLRPCLPAPPATLSMPNATTRTTRPRCRARRARCAARRDRGRRGTRP